MRRSSRARMSDDPYLDPFRPAFERRARRARDLKAHLARGHVSLADFASGHEYYGLHRRNDAWVLTEWAPNATTLFLVGPFSDWQERPELALTRLNEKGDWQITLPLDALHHEQLYRLRIHWHGGSADRIPAWARRTVQDPTTHIFSAQVWQPDEPYTWQHAARREPADALLIYEAHVGMALEREGVGTFDEFREQILPRIVKAGYNTLQLMALMEHPYYGSFGYHVSSFFALSSRFGTPEAFKALVDAAHAAGLRVIMDLVHSHAVRNEIEGLGRYDGTRYQFFHEGPRGEHQAWDSLCFDYAKPEVLHFLLSNCRYWLDEYRLDGFRFDGITSMLYHDHGLGTAFTTYDQYFDSGVDDDALSYLALANEIVHQVNPHAITIAEDMSGMPGLGATLDEGGCHFDARLAMGLPDMWFRITDEVRDEDWSVSHIWHELTNRRSDESTISYVESHDQALVGGKSFVFQLIDSAMYDAMGKEDQSMAVDRGMALHKMARLATLATSDLGYLNFMGNEFGHPEWVDFPREGNAWSYHHARRLWHLRDDPSLRYHHLADFDEVMINQVGRDEAFALNLPQRLAIREADKVLAFARGDLYFILNFHPTQSFTDYDLEVIPGRYALVFDSDEPRFGGHARVQPGQVFQTQTTTADHLRHHCLRLYLPCRTALVLRKT